MRTKKMKLMEKDAEKYQESEKGRRDRNKVRVEAGGKTCANFGRRKRQSETAFLAE